MPGILPNSLIALLSVFLTIRSEPTPWPTSQYGPLPLSPRDAEVYDRLLLQQQQPISLRKMPSHDPGQMFHLSDWYFDDLDTNRSASTAMLDLPVLSHLDRVSSLDRLLPFLQKRDFNCPTDTNSCASIGASYGCCPTGTTCQIDSSGSLGCCPGSSGTCSGSTPTQCPNGYTSCSLFHGGGGCCAQGFQCQSQGCVGVSTTIVVVESTVIMTSTSTTSSVPPSTSTTTVSTSSSTSSSSSSSLPTSTSTSPTTTETETTPLIPVAPASVTLTTSTSSTPTTIYLSACPTGYYACSAVFNAGSCCQIGRDCARTSCPPLVTSTALVSNGVTIADVSASGVCATGWSTCGSNVGGGCCPTGYGCGTAICSATATGAQASLGSAVGKEGSSSAAIGRSISLWMIAAVAITGCALF